MRVEIIDSFQFAGATIVVKGRSDIKTNMGQED
jgi:hypothetical protein